jgi:hypothetical protein
LMLICAQLGGLHRGLRVLFGAASLVGVLAGSSASALLGEGLSPYFSVAAFWRVASTLIL